MFFQEKAVRTQIDAENPAKLCAMDVMGDVAWHQTHVIQAERRRRLDAFALGNGLAALEVDQRPLDAAAANVDSQNVRHVPTPVPQTRIVHSRGPGFNPVTAHRRPEAGKTAMQAIGVPGRRSFAGAILLICFTMFMKCLPVLFTYLMTSSDPAAAQGPGLADLGELRWKYRVILVFASEAEASSAVSNLEALAPGIEERDIAWFVLDGPELHSNYRGTLGATLRERLEARYFTPVPSDTAVLLIGKDGGVKARSADLDLEATFGLIDQMPMRRAEMRRKGDGPE